LLRSRREASTLGVLAMTQAVEIEKTTTKARRLEEKTGHCEERSDTSPSSSGLTGGSPDVDTDYRVKPDNDGGLSLDYFARAAKQVLLGYTQRRAVDFVIARSAVTWQSMTQSKVVHLDVNAWIASLAPRSKYSWGTRKDGWWFLSLRGTK